MINKELRENLETHCILFDSPSFDNSIVGMSTETGSIVYDLYKMIEELSKDENMTNEQAQEFIECNTLRSLPYMDPEYRPIVIYPVEEQIEYNNMERE